MKKKYTEPEVNVIRVEDNNVICTSIGICAGGGTNETSVDYLNI